MITPTNNKNSGRAEVTTRLLEAVCEILDNPKDKDLAAALGIMQASLIKWRTGEFAPTVTTLKKIISHMMCGWVDPIYEIHPISPIKAGKSWNIHRTKQDRDEFRKALELRHGVYIFYDSSGSVSYIGKSKNLFIEIEQQLAHKLLHTTYIGTGSQPVATQLVQGEVAHYMSVYTTLVPEAVHNLEAILLRSIPNDNNNRNQAKFKFGTVEGWKV